MLKKLLIVALILSSVSFAKKVPFVKSTLVNVNKMERFSLNKLEVYAIGIKMYDANKVQIDYSTFKMYTASKESNNRNPQSLGNGVQKIVVSKSIAEKLIPESKKILVPGNKVAINKGTFDIRPRNISFNVGENGVKNIYIQNGIIIVD